VTRGGTENRDSAVFLTRDPAEVATLAQWYIVSKERYLDQQEHNRGASCPGIIEPVQGAVNATRVGQGSSKSGVFLTRISRV